MKVWTAITTTSTGIKIIAQGGETLLNLHRLCVQDDPAWTRNIRFALRKPIPNPNKQRFMIAMEHE